MTSCITACLTVIQKEQVCFGSELNQRLFLQDTFKGTMPKQYYLWVTPEVRPLIERILSHEYKGLRIKYWKENDRFAWIFEETAKDTTVCVGIVVSQEKIELLEILSAEGRYGSLVKNINFTNQFKNTGVDEKSRLTKSIDGISGATISVNTVSRFAQLALALVKMQNSKSDPVLENHRH